MFGWWSSFGGEMVFAHSIVWVACRLMILGLKMTYHSDGVRVRFPVRFQAVKVPIFGAVKVPIFGGFPVENPTRKANRLKAL